MNPLINSWMFFPSLICVRFAPSADHAMDHLLLASGFAERKSLQLVQPDSPDDVPLPSPPMQPVRSYPTDVPVPEPFDVPVPEPMDIPPPDPTDVPPPKHWRKEGPRPRSVP